MNAAKLITDLAERAVTHAGRASQLLRYGSSSMLELERANKELSIAVSLVSESVDYHLMLAETFRRAYDFSSAINSLRFVLHLQPNNAVAKGQLREIFMASAKEMLRRKCYEDGIAHLNNVIKFDPNNSEAWILKTLSFVHLNDWRSALECAGRAISLIGANTAELYVLRAKIYWALGLGIAGNNDMRRANEIDRHHPEVVAFIERSFAKAEILYDHGMAKLGAGDLDGALECMQQALQLSQHDMKLYITISKIHRLLGNLDKALFALQDAAAFYEQRAAEDAGGGSAIAMDTLSLDQGSKELGMRDDDSVNSHEEQLCAVSPGEARRSRAVVPSLLLRQMNLVFNEMALRYAGSGDYTKAINLFNKVIRSERERCTEPGAEPMDYRFFMNRADCYRLQGLMAYAMSDYHSALEVNPGAWEIRTKVSLLHYQSGVDYFNSSDFQACVSELTAAIQLNNRVSGYFVLRGRANYYQGYYHDSCEDFKAAKLLDPDNEEALMYLNQFGEGDNHHSVSATSLLPRVSSVARVNLDAHQSSSAKKVPRPAAAAAHQLPDHVPRVEIVREGTTQRDEGSSGLATFEAFLPMIRSESASVLDRQTSKPALVPSAARVELISQSLNAALTAAAKATETSFKRVLEEPINLVSNDPTWVLLETAKNSVAELSVPLGKRVAKATKKPKEKPAMTVVALKRLSLEKTRLSLLNKTAILSGIVSRSDDPELLALKEFEAIKKAAGKLKRQKKEETEMLKNTTH